MLQARPQILTRSAWEKVDHQGHECQAKVSVLSQGETTLTDIQSEDGEVLVILGEVTYIRPEKVLQARETDTIMHIAQNNSPDLNSTNESNPMS